MQARDFTGTLPIRIVLTPDFGEPTSIDAEIDRRVPLMADGGYVPLPDHLITPDTPLDDYRYYLDRIRALGGDVVSAEVSALTGEGMEGWLSWLEDRRSGEVGARASAG